MKALHLSESELKFIDDKASEVAEKLKRRVDIAVRIREIDQQLHELDPSRYAEPI